jgi:hypothetical protein
VETITGKERFCLEAVTFSVETTASFGGQIWEHAEVDSLGTQHGSCNVSSVCSTVLYMLRSQRS